jgi:hypothetical protein
MFTDREVHAMPDESHPQFALYLPATIRKDFESEPLDSSWSSAAELAIRRELSTLGHADQLALASHEVSCRTGTCRVLLIHTNYPRDWNEFSRLVEPVAQLARRIKIDASMFSGVKPIFRGGFAGEPMTSELYFLRSQRWGVAIMNMPFPPPIQHQLPEALN